LPNLNFGSFTEPSPRRAVTTGERSKLMNNRMIPGGLVLLVAVLVAIGIIAYVGGVVSH